MESACFFIRSDGVGFDDFGGLRDKVMSASNLADHERNQEFWNWIEDFPRSLEQVLYDEGFRSYFAWEEEWVRQQNVIYGKELREIQDILDVCSKRYPTASIKTIEIVLNPIKCVYSTDYHLIGERFIFCSGTFDKDSVIHEFLHPIVHPVVEAHRKDILRHRIHYPGIDESYYLSGDEMGQLNAFEEYFVRRLTNIVCAKHPPNDLGGF